MAKTGKQYNIAVIGPEDLISGFSALGVHIFEAKNSTDALAIIKKIRAETRDDAMHNVYGTIFVIDHLLSAIPEDEYIKISTGALPAVISIPGLSSDTQANTHKLKALTEKAIGSDILSSE